MQKTALQHAQQKSYPIEKIRAEFPILSTQMNNRPLVYLDHAASTQKPECVIHAIQNLWEKSYANIHRGLYSLSEETTTAYESARTQVANFLGAEPEGTVFTRNATEAINLVAATWGKQNLKRGDLVAITALEHHANIVPWQFLRDELGITLHILYPDAEGHFSVAGLAKQWKPEIKLLSIPHVVNSVGTLLPVAELVALAHKNHARVLVDGCQAAPRLPVNFNALGADFYVFSGHKMYAPSGIGILLAKPEILKEMPPYQGGGDMIKTVTFENTTFAEAPAKFEAGTPNIEGAIGLGAAVQFLGELGMENVAAHEAEIMAYAHTALGHIAGLKIIGQPDVGCLSFILENAHPSDVATLLNQCGIAVRSGHHCAQPAMAHFGMEGTVRASFGITTTKEEINILCEGLTTVNKLLK